MKEYTRNQCNRDVCSIEGAITPGSTDHQLQVAVFSDPADDNGSLSQLSRVNLTRSDMVYLIPKVTFTWGTAQRVIVLLICLTDDSDCGLLEESGDETQGKAEVYRLPCPAQSKCNLCPQQREVLDNYTVSLGQNALSILSMLIARACTLTHTRTRARGRCLVTI